MLATVASAQTPNPFLYYTFNETGTAAQSSGLNKTPLTLFNSSGAAANLHSASGLGVSGLPGDGAFDNTASTGMGDTGVGGVALLPAGTTGTISSFTFVTWVKVATEVGESARLMEDGAISIQCYEHNLTLYVNGDTAFVTSGQDYTLTNEWMFVAVTYDATQSTNNVNFYIGSQSGAVVQSGNVGTLNQGPAITGTDTLGFGNDSSSSNARPLDGLMDDVRLYIGATDNSGVLTLAQLENLRELDVSHASVPLAPIISSTLSATATNGLAFDYQILAANDPTSFTANGLPPGLGVATSTGLISGTPTESGTFEAAISAINLGGTDSVELSLVVITPPAPVISSDLSTTGTIGAPFTYQIVASNEPTGFTAASLPSGFSVNASTGLISGTPAETGTFEAAISAINAGGTDAETLVLTLLPVPPAITSGLPAAGVNGTAYSYQILATNSPFSFNATGLPPGLSVNPSTGLISGTPSAGGVFPITISATNGGGTTSIPLSLTVTTSLPELKGSYAGLGAVGGTNQALLTLSVTAKGAFTGKFTTAGVTEKLKGAFNQYGTFSGPTVALSANAAVPGVSGTITTVTTGGPINYSVAASLLGTFKPATLPPGLAGAYTAMLPALSGTDPSLPHAPGYGTMTVSTKGAVHLSGKLGDGTAFTAAAQLDADGKTWTLFDLLYGKKTHGTIAGTMTFEALPGSDADGAINWIKPPQATGVYYPTGFAASTNLMAAKYAAAPFTTGTGIAIGGGNLPVDDVTDSLTISSKDKVTVTGADAGVKVTLTLAKGAFTGTFLDPADNNAKTSFGGVIYEKPAAEGFGLFLGTDQSGSVDISP